MKKICIALDYNPSAEKVAKTGFKYAKALGAETTLVHVIADVANYTVNYSPIMGYTGSFAGGNSEILEDLYHVADSFLTSAVKHLGDRSIKTVVLQGDAAPAILEYVVGNRMDLLVLGTHSHSILENILMGNTAVKLVRHTKIPLLIVPTKK